MRKWRRWKLRCRRERIEKERLERDCDTADREFLRLEAQYDELLTAVLEFQQVLQDLLGPVKK